MHRAWIVACLILGPALTGCVTGLAEDTAFSSAQESAATDEDEAPQTVWYHRPGGEPLSDKERTAYVEEHGLREAIRRDTGFRAWEPTLGITEDGTIFFLAEIGKSGIGPATIRSQDQGRTWEDVTPGVTTLGIFGGPGRVPPVSFDPFLEVDRDTGRVFVSHLQYPACAWLSWSDDQGASWSHNPVGCSQPAGYQDHQNIGVAEPRAVDPVGYDNVVYYCIAQARGRCAPSFDGGQTFGPSRDAKSGCAHQGQLVSGPEGRAYVAGACPGWKPFGGMTADDGLSWQLMKIAPEGRVADHEVRLAVDGDGIVYALWIDRDSTRPMMAYSTDHGSSWSEPVDVGVAPVNGSALPAIDAHGNGTVALSYVGTPEEPERGESSGGSVELSADTWHGYMALIPNAAQQSPVIETHQLTQPGETLTKGWCGVWRCPDIGDFIDLTFGPQGQPWTSMVDGCFNGECPTLDEGFVATLRKG